MTNSRLFGMFVMLSLAMCIIAPSNSARAALATNLIVNGDFEDVSNSWGTGSGENPPDWPPHTGTYKPFAEQQTGALAIGGSGTSAYVGNTPKSKSMRQLVDPEPFWHFDVDFASNDPGSAERSLNLQLHHGATGSSHYMMLKVEGNGSGAGDLWAYGRDYSVGPGEAWRKVLDEAVIFSDVDTDPGVHHLQVIGHYDDSTPTYDVLLTDSLGVTHSASGLRIWRTSQPTSGNSITAVQFQASLSEADQLIDNVMVTQVPEPSALLLLCLGAFGLICGRRRR